MIARKQRIPFRDFSTLDEKDRELAERNKVDGQVINLFKVLMNNPKVTKKWLPFAGHIMVDQSVAPREREIAILRIGWLNQAQYEWEQHEIVGKRAGLNDGDIEKIKQGPKADWNEKERAIVQAADDLFENSVVADSTWETLAKHYSTEQLMDLVFTIGQYNMVSWVLNSFGVPLDGYLPGAKK